MTFTYRVIQESMRLYPSAWSMSRRALADDEIGGYFIPQGAIIAISPYTVHRHPTFWANPERFDPDRFLPEAFAARHNFAYIPFGGGARQCIGNEFAMLESALIVPAILQRYRLQLVADHPVVPHVWATLRPRHGIRVTLQRRV
jgi:cytochrome P450